MKSARDQMDIVNAYEATGTYRGAAALCGTTHKTVKRVLARQQAGQVGRRPGRPAPQHRRGAGPRRREGAGHRRADQRQAPAAGGPGGGLRRLGAQPAPGGGRRRRGRGSGRAARIARGCPCPASTWSWTGPPRAAGSSSAPCWPGAGTGSCASPPTRRGRPPCACWRSASRSWAGCRRWCSTDRMGCLKAGMVANVVVPHPELRARSPPTTASGPTSARRPTPSRRAWSRTWRATPSATCWCPRSPTGAGRTWPRPTRRRGPGAPRSTAASTARSAAVPAERLATERGVLRPLPSLRPPLRRGEPRKVDRLGMVRFGSPRRYAVPERAGRGSRWRWSPTRRRWSSATPAPGRRSPATPRWPRARWRSGRSPRRWPPGAPRGACAPAPRPRWPSWGWAPRPRPSCGPPPRPGRRACRPSWPPSSTWSPAWGRGGPGRRAAAGDALPPLPGRRRARHPGRPGPGAPEPAGPGAGLGPLALGLPAVPVRPLSAYALAPALPPSAPGAAPAAGGAR